LKESYLEEEIPVFRLLVYRSTLKMVAVGFFETSVSLTILWNKSLRYPEILDKRNCHSEPLAALPRKECHTLFLRSPTDALIYY